LFVIKGIVVKNKGEIKLRFYLFPERFRWIGLFILLLGLVSTYLYFWGGKPDFFNSKIFAVYTSYVTTRYFVIAQTNLLDEIGAIFSIVGLVFIGFSKEKTENEVIGILRAQSLLISLVSASAIWILFFLFIYGWPIFIFSSLIFIVFLTLFIVVFRIMLYRFRKEISDPI
jgi:hypothetical protein